MSFRSLGKMKQYLEALNFCYENGTEVESRAGKVKKCFGYQMQFDLSDGFPAVTTKKLAWKSVVSELLWFIEGSDDERRLAEIRYGPKKVKAPFNEKYVQLELGLFRMPTDIYEFQNAES